MEPTELPLTFPFSRPGLLTSSSLNPFFSFFSSVETGLKGLVPTIKMNGPRSPGECRAPLSRARRAL